MMAWHHATAGERRLLPEARLGGPMPWVIAIMLFLTVLAAAAGLGLRQAATHLRSGLADQITIQIVEGDHVERERQATAAMHELDRLAGIGKHRRVDSSELEALLAPWLGDSFTRGEIPIPAMIDVTLAPGGADRIDAIGEALKSVAPAVRISSHAQWLKPIEALIGTLLWLALALVLLMAAATAFTVVLAARAALDTHRETIDVMHLLGATDGQIARLFQRRIATDAMIGGLIGFSGAVVVVLILSQRIESVGSELFGAISLTTAAWIGLLALPLAGTILAMATARLTILGTLERIL